MANIEQAEHSVNRLIEMFDSGDLPERIAMTEIARVNGDRPSSAWSLGNQLLMLLAGTEDARGYRQWQQAGRQVVKGSKALYILAPLTKRFTEENDKGEKEKRTIVTGFKAIPVFRVEDTEGEPLEYPDYSPVALPPLYEVAERYGVSVRYAPKVDGSWGSYAPGLKRIELNTDAERVFWHELAHAVHDDITPGGLKGGQHPAQEVVAETVAATLSLMYGFEGYVAESADYITGYAGTGASKAVMQVLADVRKVLAAIFDDTAAGTVNDEQEVAA